MTDDAVSVGRRADATETPPGHADRLVYHMTKLREARAAVEVAKGPLAAARALVKAAQDELAKRFGEAKTDLGRVYTREYLDSLIRDGDAGIRALVEHERIRARDKVVLSQPVFGIQQDLFPGDETPTAARDSMAWQAEGYLRGLRGDLDEIKDGDPPEFLQEIQHGFERGQREVAERVQAAMEAKARGPDADQKPLDLNPPEPGSPEAKAAERKAIAAAKEKLGVKVH